MQVQCYAVFHGVRVKLKPVLTCHRRQSSVVHALDLNVIQENAVPAFSKEIVVIGLLKADHHGIRNTNTGAFEHGIQVERDIVILILGQFEIVVVDFFKSPSFIVAHPDAVSGVLIFKVPFDHEGQFQVRAIILLYMKVEYVGGGSPVTPCPKYKCPLP